MRAGYVITGIVLITLASVLGVLASIAGLLLGFYNVSASAAGTSTVSASTIALASFIQNSFYLSLLVSGLFYIIGASFLWEGFKLQTVAHYPVANYPIANYPVATQTQQPQVLAICPSCKSRVSVESKFCPVCGANLGLKT